MTETAENLIAIHESFAATKHGMLLGARVRYERYKPEEVSNERWTRLLGADVNNLTHLTLTYGLTRSFGNVMNQVQPGTLTKRERAMLETAALIHDWAEAVVGDVSFGDKTAEHDAAEKAAFEANLAEFYRGAGTDIIEEARTKVIFDHGSKLGRMFNAIERVGYLRTALRASDHLRLGDASECRNGFSWIVADVLSNQPPALLEYATEYPPVKLYLGNKALDITAAFATIQAQPEVFANYGANEQAKLVQFTKSAELWTDWASSNQAA